MCSDVPEYRVRLFLSVDLVGSTAYKAKGTSNLEWMKGFQKFYGEFPLQLRKNYANFCESNREIAPIEVQNEPKVWKTIGDEIIFVNRLSSIAHLSASFEAFFKTLVEFGAEVAPLNLNTKGNAWIAAFPTPNRSIRLSLNGLDPLMGEKDFLSEAFEAQVDAEPEKYDFLGKGIDGGFRIAKNSTVDDLTISPGLALLLCRAAKNRESTKFNQKFRFHEPQVFKGVVNGSRYPVVSVITDRNTISRRIEIAEADLLGKPPEADVTRLHEYLEDYISHNSIECPALKLTFRSADVDPPDHYKTYINDWAESRRQVEHQQKLEEAAAKKDDAESPAIRADDTLRALNAFLAMATKPKKQ